MLAKEGEDANIKSQLQFTDVDLEACLGELFGIRRLEGKGNLTFSLEATGDSVIALTRTLGGTATLDARSRAPSRASTSSSCSSGWSSARSRSPAISAAAARRSSGSTSRCASPAAPRRSRT